MIDQLTENTQLTAPSWNKTLIQTYNVAGPRYTSYPTAPHLSEQFAKSDLVAALARSNQRGSPLSLYFHLPFCDTVCYFCACNKIVTANKSHAQPYLQRLNREMAIWAESVDSNRLVNQLHWGGGTPTFISDAEKRQLMSQTRNHFKLLDDDSGDYSVEVHPGRMNLESIAVLREIGFNRLSMGVQDFSPQVQQAVNRFNSLTQVRDLIAAARREQYHSLSIYIIYGLPLQTVDSIKTTIQQVIDLSPDRLSLFNYAHMPALFKTQRQIPLEKLPSPEEKLAMLQQSIELLVADGYVYIGMDHFAKPCDSLVKAQQQGSLQRNFQGYSTHGDCDLLAFGVSAISTIDDVLVQNHKQIDHYNQAVDQGCLATGRGLSLSTEDRLRGTIIMQLICHFSLDIKLIENQFQICFAQHFADELVALESMERDQLVVVDKNKIEVLDAGRLLIRPVCMVFDQYIEQTNRFSKVI
ncbi:oxygen-independent coproporphyrinogen III oxidase [Porticoccaceae bacterium]|nr:oxygen-independent coproporphyrinogen III oxidase [Porticoccaceae bacterium]